MALLLDNEATVCCVARTGMEKFKLIFYEASMLQREKDYFSSFNDSLINQLSIKKDNFWWSVLVGGEIFAGEC